MIGTIIEWLFGQKSIERLLHRNVKVQFFFILLLVVGTAYLSVWFYHLNWEWKNVRETVSEVKTEQAQSGVVISNAVVGAIAPLKKELKQDEATDSQYWRKVDRVLDYIDDKDGKQLDFIGPKLALTNFLASTSVVTQAVTTIANP